MALEVRSTEVNSYGNVVEIICPECNSSNIEIISGSKCWHCNHVFLGPFNFVLKRVTARMFFHLREKGGVLLGNE